MLYKLPIFLALLVFSKNVLSQNTFYSEEEVDQQAWIEPSKKQAILITLAENICASDAIVKKYDSQKWLNFRIKVVIELNGSVSEVVQILPEDFNSPTLRSKLLEVFKTAPSFHPAYLNDKPVRSTTQIMIRFVQEEGDATLGLESCDDEKLVAYDESLNTNVWTVVNYYPFPVTVIVRYLSPETKTWKREQIILPSSEEDENQLSGFKIVPSKKNFTAMSKETVLFTYYHKESNMGDADTQEKEFVSLLGKDLYFKKVFVQSSKATIIFDKKFKNGYCSEYCRNK